MPDFPDALVALSFLQRGGDGPDARYSNTPESAIFLDRNSAGYIGGILEMANARLYRFWADLTEALKTGTPQNETKHSGEPMFAKLYADPARLEQFMNAMSGISAGNFKAFAENFDFSKFTTLCDVGGATGQLSCMVAAAQPAHALHQLRSSQQSYRSRHEKSRRRASATGLRPSAATSSPIHCQGRRDHDGDDPA